MHARGERTAPAEPMHVRSVGGRHGSFAREGMHRTDTPSLFVLTRFAREHRKAPTRSEALLWAQLRGCKLGARFRRQAVLGRFIVDFLAPCHRLVVEVDGSVHDSPEQQARDVARQAELERLYDVRFVRVSAQLVERDMLAALTRIRAAL